jgi:hypothetical protein
VSSKSFRPITCYQISDKGKELVKRVPRKEKEAVHEFVYAKVRMCFTIKAAVYVVYHLGIGSSSGYHASEAALMAHTSLCFSQASEAAVNGSFSLCVSFLDETRARVSCCTPSGTASSTASSPPPRTAPPPSRYNEHTHTTQRLYNTYIHI